MNCPHGRNSTPSSRTYTCPQKHTRSFLICTDTSFTHLLEGFATEAIEVLRQVVRTQSAANLHTLLESNRV